MSAARATAVALLALAACDEGPAYDLTLRIHVLEGRSLRYEFNVDIVVVTEEANGVSFEIHHSYESYVAAQQAPAIRIEAWVGDEMRWFHDYPPAVCDGHAACGRASIHRRTREHGATSTTLARGCRNAVDVDEKVVKGYVRFIGACTGPTRSVAPVDRGTHGAAAASGECD